MIELVKITAAANRIMTEPDSYAALCEYEMHVKPATVLELVGLIRLQEAALTAEQARYESLAQAFPSARESVHVTASELSCVINWLEGGRDPKDAAKELRLYCERAWTGAQKSRDGSLIDEGTMQQGGGELPQDERAAFDEWWAKFESAHPDWRYADAYAMRWNVWRARAALAQRAASVPAQAVVDDLSALVRQLVHALGKAAPSHSLPARAMDYLQRKGLQGSPLRSASAVPAASVQPELTVWYGPMHESNGKSNFTATLMRKGASLFDTNQFTFSRSEYPERVRYDADSMRYLIGEIDTEPCVMDYDGDKHSGYVDPHHKQPDIGRDAALVQSLQYARTVIDTLSEKAHSKADRIYCMNVLKDGNCIDAALAAQAAPEVASVPDAGDEPVAIRWPDGRGRYHFADVSDTVTQDALSKSEDLYTRPQPAPAVLSDEQIAGIANNIDKGLWTYGDEASLCINSEGVAVLARAVLAAAVKCS